jgi:group I intron endonuclease
MIIYKTTNLINQKFYVGKDTHNNPNYYGSGKRLKLAIQKYGIENFKKEIIEICDSMEKLNERERFWIKELNAINEGYNISLGGDGGDTISNNPNKKLIGKRHSEKMKDPFVNKNKAKGRVVRLKKKDDPNWINPRLGKPSPLIGRTTNKKGIPNPKHSEWMKKNNPFKGRTLSDEHKLKLKKLASKPKSDEHKRKISETLKGNKPGNMRKVIVDGVEYESLSYAARQVGIPTSTMKNRLKSPKFDNYKYKD